jgi:hypothetical protein
MSGPWKSVFFELPNDTDVVWIRVISIYGEPVLAEYDLGQAVFITEETGVTVPIYMVGRWKVQ